MHIEGIQALEQRQVLAPVLSTNALVATLTAAATPTNPFLGTVQITQGAALDTSAAAFTSLSQLTSSSSFGGDMVRIQAGPGGDFGKAVYAISRGAGSNVGAINKPGVIYRVDPATGKSSVFADLNTILGGNAGNTFGAETGLVNWFDLSFDSEGYFDGRTSLFVSSVDRTNPSKNVIFRFGSDGSFLGAFVQFTEGAGAGTFTRAPSAILVPPPEQQTFLRGLIAGDASETGSTGFAALYFDADLFRPGTDLSGAALPAGVSATGLTFGPQTGLTSTSTSDYGSLVYSSFTDFGDPGGPNNPAAPGLSGVQGIGGGFLISGGAPVIGSYIDDDFTTVDDSAAILSTFRRFQDIAFDDFGYFSYGATATDDSGAAITGVTPIPPAYVGSVFVADLGTGLSVDGTPVDPLPTDDPVHIPIQGPGAVGVEQDANGNLVPIFTNGNTTGGTNIGGRIVRVNTDGTVTPFAEGFNTSGSQFSSSFVESTLSITFSADGTTFYAADNDGIWQFKSVLDLAGSTSGSLIGLNDLRTLGVPYDGQDSAVAVLDTGIDSRSTPLRGRVAGGTNVVTGGLGNDDAVSLDLANGHGTLIAGAIAQFVPQATLVPVNAFTPNTSSLNGTTSKYLFNALQWLSKNPNVNDPIRPNKVDRIITTAIGFGTDVSFETEMTAYGLDAYPQVVLALKGAVYRLRRLGNQTIAASGQFGSPVGSGTTSTTVGDLKGEALPAILNEVISVTGTYSFPFTATASSDPSDPVQGALPRPAAPVVLSGSPADPSIGTGAELAGNAGIVGAGDLIVYSDKLLAAANRTWTTDYAAPAVNVPTFRRSFTGGGAGYLVFQEAGTSLSAGVMTGSFSMVASAIDYWTDLAQTTNGVTADGYLNTMVGTRQLAFGNKSLVDLSAYASPDGINSILEWTAVPVEDAPNTVETTLPEPLFGLDQYRNFARVDVGNAIAAIEGTIALNYLQSGGYFDTMDTNKDGLLTAQEIQTFVDKSTTIGLPEAGAMARLLGGTATYGTPLPTTYGEEPDQGDVLQRRFNFFDYVADGQLNGVVSIDQLKALSHNLLPSPDAFVVTDRQRAAGNQYLVDSHAPRNFYQLKHLLPTFVWVPKRLAQKYQNVNLLAYVGRRQLPANTAPFYNLFEQTRKTANTTKTGTKTSGTKSNVKTTRNTNNNTTTGTGSTTGGTKTTTSGGTTTVTSTTTTVPINRQQEVLEAIRNLATGQQAQTTGRTLTPTPAASCVTTTTLAETRAAARAAAKAKAKAEQATPASTTAAVASALAATDTTTTAGTPAGISDGSTLSDEELAATTSSAVVSPYAAAQTRRAQRKAQIDQKRAAARERAIRANQLGLNREDKSVWEKITDTMFGWL
jgi:hypothetical protein